MAKKLWHVKAVGPSSETCFGAHVVHRSVTHVQNRTLTAKANVAGAATIRMVHCLLSRSTMKKPMASLSSDARIRALTIRCRSCGLITTFGMGGLL